MSGEPTVEGPTVVEEPTVEEPTMTDQATPSPTATGVRAGSGSRFGFPTGSRLGSRLGLPTGSRSDLPSDSPSGLVPDPVTDLVERVRRRLANGPTDLTPATVAAAVRGEAGGVLGDEEVQHALTVLRQEFVGAGPLDPLLRDPGTTDVLVTAPDQVWVDGAEGLRRTGVAFPGEPAVRRLAQRLAVAAGRRLDDAAPYVDGWLPGSVRLHAVLPPIAPTTCLSLRVLRPAAHDLATLRDLGTFDHRTADLLRAIVVARQAFLVVGGTGSGKTTLLAALLGCVPHHERVVCVEDAGELHPAHPQFVRLLARGPNIEGVGEITVRDLVRQALRMRPDRIVVGEVRGAEVCDLLSALNTGHDGGAGTLHANSPAEVPARLEALAALGGLDRHALHSQLTAAVKVVLHVRRAADGTRHLAEIGVLHRKNGDPVVEPAWRRDSGWHEGAETLASLVGGAPVGGAPVGEVPVGEVPVEEALTGEALTGRSPTRCPAVDSSSSSGALVGAPSTGGAPADGRPVPVDGFPAGASHLPAGAP